MTNEYALETDDTEIKISVALTESGELWQSVCHFSWERRRTPDIQMDRRGRSQRRRKA